jgi:hypothetical protein
MTLQQWFRRRGGTTNPAGRPVVLFPDTFNNYLHADVGVACVEELEAAGWRVIIPARHVCCGRPLYDYGFLDSAQIYLRRVLDELRPYIRVVHHCPGQTGASSVRRASRRRQPPLERVPDLPAIPCARFPVEPQQTQRPCSRPARRTG